MIEYLRTSSKTYAIKPFQKNFSINCNQEENLHFWSYELTSNFERSEQFSSPFLSCRKIGKCNWHRWSSVRFFLQSNERQSASKRRYCGIRLPKLVSSWKNVCLVPQLFSIETPNSYKLDWILVHEHIYLHCSQNTFFKSA